MERYFSYVNTLGQLVIIRQDSDFYTHNNKLVANCKVFIKNEVKVTSSNIILERNEIENRKEITLDEVYHVVAHTEVKAL